MTEPLRVRGRDEWRSWLRANHLDSKEVWLVIRRKRSIGPGVKLEDAIEEAISFGWIDSKMTPLSDEEFLLRFSPRRVGAIWSRRNREMAQRLISEGRMTDPGYTSIEEAKRSGRWDSAYSSLTMPEAPADLEAAPKSAEGAFDRFQRLSNSAKLKYVFWMSEGKRPETRKKRIAEVVKKMGG